MRMLIIRFGEWLHRAMEPILLQNVCYFAEIWKNNSQEDECFEHTVWILICLFASTEQLTW